MTLPSAAEAGLQTTTHQFVDLNELPVLRQKIPVSDRLLTAAQAEQYQKGNVDITQAAPPPAPTLPSQAPVQLTVATPTAPAVTPAIPAPGAPEIRPNDPPRFQERINQLYGRAKTAEERAQAAEQRLLDLTQRLEARFTQPQTPYSNQFGQYPPAAPAQSANPFESAQTPQQPAGQFVSRAELENYLRQVVQVNAQQQALNHAHTVSRLEAERRFPDVYQNPELRTAADQIFAQDQALQYDPHGYEKAAAIARGLYYDPSIGHGNATAPASVRKESLTGFGPSVPEGQAQSNDREARYQAALAYARSTGLHQDFARALRIAQGLE